MKSRPDFDDLPFAPASPAEVAAAARLRDALDAPVGGPRDGGGDVSGQDDVLLVRALTAAHAPRGLDDAEHRRLVEEALFATSARRKERRGGTVIRVAFGVSGLFAAAAAVVIFVARQDEKTPSLYVARSTQSLFQEPFQVGGTAARVDRIASARAAEFRDNQFTRWGVR